MTESQQTPQPTRESLLVMANPFRTRVYDQLLIFGDTTARKLAGIVHLSEASVNQHMREMETIGWVYPVNPEAPARQRIWHARPGGMRLGDLPEQADYADEARAWLRANLEAESRVLQDWIDIAPSWPEEWQGAVERWDYVLKALTSAQLNQLGLELNQLAQKWFAVSAKQEGSGDVNTRPVYLVTHAVPWPMKYEL